MGKRVETAKELVNKIIPSLILRRKNMVKSFEESNFLVGKTKDSLTGKAIGYEGFIGKKDWDKYLSDFSLVYKNSTPQERELLRGGLGRFWQTALRQSRGKGFLKDADVKKAHSLSSARSVEKITKLQAENFEKKREAIQSVWGDILGKAKKNKEGVPILEGIRALQPAKILPLLKKKFPALFPESTSVNRIQDLIVERRAGRKKLEYPKFELAPSSDPANMVLKFLKSYPGGTGLSTSDRRYFQELFRSRNVADPKLNTGNIKQDTINFAKILDSWGVLDPENVNYYKLDPEVIWYSFTKKPPSKEIRELRKGMHLAHTQPSVMPTGGSHFERYGQETIPWTGADIGGTHFLEKSAHVGSKSKNIKGQTSLEIEALKALKARDWKRFLKIDEEMLSKNIRTTITDTVTGESYPMGGWKEFGFDQGGIVNGYNKGGGVKKLLDDTLGMMSRRKFLKGMGATAASAAIPKSALKLAPAALKKGALNFAPPWVNGMLSSLKNVKDLGALSQRRSVMGGGMSVGNDAKIINLGTKNIKIYKDQEEKITYFKIKTSDEKVADDVANSQGAMPRNYWDDVELREEPGQKTITFKNQEYDGNDRHIVIDTKNKETRFVDDNWHMEAGGEDIAKDDWIEWAITPNKNEIKVALKKPLSEIDDAIVDGYSVTDMEEYGMHSYVDSFSPSGNIFGTVERMVKNMNKKKQLRREKKLNDEQVRNLKEKEMMDWEGQFRGGQGIHAYNGGGMVRERRNLQPRQSNVNVQIKPKPNRWSANNPPDMTKLLNAMAMQESTNRPDVKGKQIKIGERGPAGGPLFERGHGLLQIRPTTAYDAGYGIPKWKNFLSEWQDKDLQYEFGENYLNAAYRELGSWEDAISSWFHGIEGVRSNSPSSDYYNSVMGYYNKGGIARRPNAVPPTSGPDPYATLLDDSVTQIMNNPSEFMGTQFIQKFNKGGYVKKNAPKVIGMLTNYKPKLTMAPELKKAQSTTNQYIIYDKSLTPLHKFKTKKEGQDWLNKNYTADSNIHPEVVKPTKKTTGQRIIEEAKAEQPGAMFWGSREKIIGAPSESMTGTQWLQYMKIGKHGILNPKGYPRIKDMELNDTSLAPWLSRQGNKTVSKDVLVKQFDAMAPKMDVTVLGETTGSRIISDLSSKLKQVDTQAIRNPAIKGFVDYIKAVLPQLKESTTDDAAKGILKGIDEMVFNNFGVKDALTEGVPQRFPFEMKEVLQQLSTALGRRTAGFKTYKRSPQHRGTQTMAGGDNYREFLFKYKPGSLRQTEPQYKYAHDFNLETAERMGGVVHARTSDRADQFGRRLLHIEEIQSDMHQKINAAQRKIKRQIADWEKEGLKPHEAYMKLSKTKREEFDKLTASAKYAPRGDLKEEIGTANEQHLLLVKAKIEDLLVQKQTPAIRTRINRLNQERRKIRKMIEEEKAKMAKGDHSGIPQGPLSKTEDYNEFIMKYMLKVAREGGYDGITINTPAIKNLGMSVTGRDYKGNLIAYGPMAQGAMKKAANKSGAKFMKTYIVDEDKRAWEVPMILIKENKAAQALIDKGLPIYKKGGIVKK